MVPEAEAEQLLFVEALENPALQGRVLHNNLMYQDPSEGPCILLVNDAVLAGEIEYRRQFQAKARGRITTSPRHSIIYAEVLTYHST